MCCIIPICVGVYRPDLMSRYGSQVALQMGRDDLDATSVLSDESTWLQRQHDEVETM